MYRIFLCMIGVKGFEITGKITVNANLTHIRFVLLIITLFVNISESILKMKIFFSGPEWKETSVMTMPRQTWFILVCKSQLLTFSGIL